MTLELGVVGAILLILTLAWDNRHHPDVWRDDE